MCYCAAPGFHGAARGHIDLHLDCGRVKGDRDGDQASAYLCGIRHNRARGGLLDRGRYGCATRQGGCTPDIVGAAKRFRGAQCDCTDAVCVHQDGIGAQAEGVNCLNCTCIDRCEQSRGELGCGGVDASPGCAQGSCIKDIALCGERSVVGTRLPLVPPTMAVRTRVSPVKAAGQVTHGLATLAFAPPSCQVGLGRLALDGSYDVEFGVGLTIAQVDLASIASGVLGYECVNHIPNGHGIARGYRFGDG